METEKISESLVGTDLVFHLAAAQQAEAPKVVAQSVAWELPGDALAARDVDYAMAEVNYDLKDVRLERAIAFLQSDASDLSDRSDAGEWRYGYGAVNEAEGTTAFAPLLSSAPIRRAMADPAPIPMPATSARPRKKNGK